MFEISNKQSAQKVHKNTKKGTESSLILEILMIKTRFCYLISLLFDYE